MSINRREFLSLSYSCAAAFSVWIPKPLQAQQTAGKLFNQLICYNGMAINGASVAQRIEQWTSNPILGDFVNY